MKTNNGSESKRRLIQLSGNAITIAVPNTDGNAAGPGNGMFALRRKIGNNIRIKPVVPRRWASGAGRERVLRVCSITASATPIPSSHARSGSR